MASSCAPARSGTNLSMTSTAFCAAMLRNLLASLPSEEPPPARSERERMVRNGTPCWCATSATAALSISTGVHPNLARRNWR
uniref:Uncharacterized protein n=1 Tax=Oryza brachyantha TaxID=4533 RepID=J3KXY8_ORYBR